MSDRRAPRREYATALLLLAVGGVLGLVAASRPWGEATVDNGLATTTQVVTGRDLVPLGPAVALLALAAVVAVPATRRAGRRVVGAVLAVAGLASALSCIVLVPELPTYVTRWVGDTGEQVASASGSTAWAVLGVAAGLMVCAAGLLAAVRGPAWPAMGRRYEREPSEQARSAPGHATHELTQQEAWDALDRGDDPTT